MFSLVQNVGEYEGGESKSYLLAYTGSSFAAIIQSLEARGSVLNNELYQTYVAKAVAISS